MTDQKTQPDPKVDPANAFPVDESYPTQDVTTIDDLIREVLGYFPEADLTLLKKAHDFSSSRHGDQKRKSGEPYILHPINVSMILAKMRMDLPSIVTGLLHDTVEDTSATIEEVALEFGNEIAQLVDGVTKISKISFKSTHEKQAENFRKMILAMAKDIRVILVKLADRTHNMRTLKHLKPKKQAEIAQETLDIYAPLANRLGISTLKIELEDLALRYLKPEVYYKLAELVSQKRSERSEYIATLIKILVEKTSQYGLKVKASGRSKHFYSIYKKMDTRKMSFDEINDLVAFRIVTQSVGECYEALGIIHSFFKPVPGRFKDYVAMPKNNLYQSLHTTVIGPFGERLEIQIRTEDMHRTAEAGVAAHWEYKEGKLSQRDAERFRWLRQLLEVKENLSEPAEFLESVKLDLFEGEIYVFTPKGEVRELPVGSTPLDFAYGVHTDVGNRCVAAKVNGRMVPLKHKLRSGDTIEILTAPHQKPSKDWLKFVRTGRAMAKIRAFIRIEERERSKQIGYDLLDREFRRYGQSLPKMEKSKDANERSAALGFPGFDEMLVSIGFGKTPPERIVQKLFPNGELVVSPEGDRRKSVMQQLVSGAQAKLRSGERRAVVRVHDLNDMLVRYGRCCSPLPGDEIIGFISRGRGVTVHKVACPRVLDMGPERLIEVSWDSQAAATQRNIRIRVVVSDEPGLLNRMSSTIAANGINIKSANIKTNPEKKAVGLFDLQVKDRDQLRECIKGLEAIPGVISVEAIK